MIPRSLQLVMLLLVLGTTACARGPVPGPEGVAPFEVRPEIAPAQPATILDGVYATSQAERGATEYAEACSACHAADLRGNSNAPSLLGVSFMFVWETRSLDELFTAIRTRMPTNAPNSLPATTYVDIVAYILAANGFPSGDAELVPDQAVLGGITIAGS